MPDPERVLQPERNVDPERVLQPERNVDPERVLAELAAVTDGVFTFADATRAGLTKRQVDRRVGRTWSAVYDGVYRITGALLTWRSELRELPGGRQNPVELTCVRWTRTVRPGLLVHESRRLAARDIELIDGIPVTTPERTILDLASTYPSAEYLERVIQAARRKRLITYESTNAMFDRHARRGLKGVRALREALERWDPTSRPTDSDMETLLLQVLREHGLAEPVVQYDVNDAAGRFLARVDAAYPEARIAIEYDSKQEHSDEFQISSDAKRRNALQAKGFWVLSARHAEMLAGGAEICGQIKAIMRRAAESA